MPKRPLRDPGPPYSGGLISSAGSRVREFIVIYEPRHRTMISDLLVPDAARNFLAKGQTF